MDGTVRKGLWERRVFMIEVGFKYRVLGGNGDNWYSFCLGSR